MGFECANQDFEGYPTVIAVLDEKKFRFKKYNFFCGAASSGGQWLSHCRGFTNTKTYHTRWDASGRVISRGKRPVADNTNTLQEIDIRARRRDSNPQYRHASGRRFTRRSARPMGWAKRFYIYCKWRSITFAAISRKNQK